MLNADETITYINNSPDTLFFLYFHLWANAYKNNSTALCKQMLKSGNSKLAMNYKEIGGYIDSLDFRINNQEIKWRYDDENIDICILFLNEPLLSRDTIIISTPFRVKINV